MGITLKPKPRYMAAFPIRAPNKVVKKSCIPASPFFGLSHQSNFGDFCQEDHKTNKLYKQISIRKAIFTKSSKVV